MTGIHYFLIDSFDSLAAISTLYFVEHSQINQIAYNGAIFRSLSRETTFSGGSGGAGGGGSVVANGFDPITWRHPNNRKSSSDYPTFTQSHSSEKKMPFSKSILSNNSTSNYSRIAVAPIASSSQRATPLNQTTSTYAVATTTESMDNDANHQLAASDDINKVFEYEENPQMNNNNSSGGSSSNYVKKVKVTHSVDVLRNVPTLMEPQKSEANAEAIVTIGSETQQELNWTSNVITDNSYLLNDVDTNLIDIGQRSVPGNGSKSEDKNLIKNRASAENDLINLHASRK